MSIYDDAAKATGEYLKAAYKGEKVNGSKKAINAIVNNGFGGLDRSHRSRHCAGSTHFHETNVGCKRLNTRKFHRQRCNRKL